MGLQGVYFPRIHYACYEKLEDAIDYAKIAGSDTKRIIGVVYNNKHPDGVGYMQGEYAWLKNAHKYPSRAEMNSSKGRLPFFKGKRKV